MKKEKDFISCDSGKQPDSLLDDDAQLISAYFDCWADRLTLMDDEFMSLCFQDNIPAVEEVLHVILERNDLKIIHLEVQRWEKSPRKKGRGIRMDIYARDAVGKYYNIEIQRSNKGACKQRARYYSAMIDSRMLKKKQSFDKMKDSYVIFITENDVLKENRPIYHIKRTILESNTVFEDGNHIIFVNGAYKNDGSKIGNLIHDFKCAKPEEMNSDVLRETTNYFKNTEGGKKSMSSIMEEFCNAVRRATTKEFNAELSKKDAALSEKEAEIEFLKAELEKEKRKNGTILN